MGVIILFGILGTIIQCVEAIEHDGYDIAIGSRYVKGWG